MVKIAVIAKSREQFEEWLYHIYSNDRNKFMYVKDIDDIRGVMFQDIIHVGTWWEMSNYHELHKELLTRVIK